MPDREVDAEDVLKQYAEAIEALRNNPLEGAVQDVRELAHPKPVIKAMLARFIELSTESDLRDWLQTAYMTLARFQELRDDERAACDWKAGERDEAGTPEHAKTYLRLMARISEESGVLRADIGRLAAPES